MRMRSHSTPLTLRWLVAKYQASEKGVVPRNSVYEEYVAWCNVNYMHPVNPASFGKLVKKQFPKLQSKRLGTRGQSKYHYYGISLKVDEDVEEEKGEERNCYLLSSQQQMEWSGHNMEIVDVNTSNPHCFSRIVEGERSGDDSFPWTMSSCPSRTSPLENSSKTSVECFYNSYNEGMMTGNSEDFEGQGNYYNYYAMESRFVSFTESPNMEFHNPISYL